MQLREREHETRDFENFAQPKPPTNCVVPSFGRTGLDFCTVHHSFWPRPKSERKRVLVLRTVLRFSSTCAFSVSFAFTFVCVNVPHLSQLLHSSQKSTLQLSSHASKSTKTRGARLRRRETVPSEYLDRFWRQNGAFWR